MTTMTTQGAEWQDQQVHPLLHIPSDQHQVHLPSLQERPLHLQPPLPHQEQQQRHRHQGVKTETTTTAQEAAHPKIKEA